MAEQPATPPDRHPWVARTFQRLWRFHGVVRQGADNARWSGDPEPAIYLAGVVYGALHAVKADQAGYGTVGWLLREALMIDGAHHKQWYLERLAEELGVTDLPDHTPGVAP